MIGRFASGFGRAAPASSVGSVEDKKKQLSLALECQPGYIQIYDEGIGYRCAPLCPEWYVWGSDGKCHLVECPPGTHHAPVACVNDLTYTPIPFDASKLTVIDSTPTLSVRRELPPFEFTTDLMGRRRLAVQNPTDTPESETSSKSSSSGLVVGGLIALTAVGLVAGTLAINSKKKRGDRR